MEYRMLGGSGLKVPVLSLGTATFGGGSDASWAWADTKLTESSRLIEIALEAGVTLFDTADVYSHGLSEEILGQAIAHRRDRLIISTKATFRSGDGPNDIGSTRKHLMAACEASLKRLGTDYIDLWHMHAFDAVTPIEETLRTLDDLVRAGKIRYVGCSNFSGWHVMKSLSIADRHGWPRYVTHQAYYSLVSREYEWELMPLALDQRVGTMVWGPLAGGLLSGKVGRNRQAPAGSRFAMSGGYGPAVAEEHLYRVVDELEAVAEECSRSASQVALNWLLGRPTVSTIVIGTRNERQLRDNLGAVEFHLTPQQVARLDTVSARPLVYPYWHQREESSERNPPPV